MLKFGKALRVKLLDFQASVQKMKLKNLQNGLFGLLKLVDQH